MKCACCVHSRQREYLRWSVAVSQTATMIWVAVHCTHVLIHYLGKVICETLNDHSDIRIKWNGKTVGKKLNRLNVHPTNQTSGGLQVQTNSDGWCGVTDHIVIVWRWAMAFQLWVKRGVLQTQVQWGNKRWVFLLFTLQQNGLLAFALHPVGGANGF